MLLLLVRALSMRARGGGAERLIALLRSLCVCAREVRVVRLAARVCCP